MKKPKRYLLFAMDTYYPSGGWSDLVDSFDTLHEAEVAAASDRSDHQEIVDLETGEVYYP